MEEQKPSNGTPDVGWKPAKHSWNISGARFCSLLWQAFKKHAVLMISVMVLVLLVLYAERYVFQAWLLFLRKYAGGAVVALSIAGFAWLLLRKHSTRMRTFGVVFATSIGLVAMFFGGGVHDYMASYFRYMTMRAVSLTELPTTSRERILPLQAVHTLARDRMNKPELPTIPDLVRSGDENRWTMAVESKVFWGQFWFPEITEVMSIPASDPSPDFSNNVRRVRFELGESFYLSHNIDTCVRRAFGLARSLNYEPGNILYLPDDSGRLVQVVTLIKWTGLFFPWPEFGGVQVIEQGPTNWFERVFLGCGKFIPPESVSKYSFLRGQNIVPYEVTRFRAQSLRYKAGTNWFEHLIAPLRWNRQSDVVIAHVPEDMNPQPYVLHFHTPSETDGKLYQYFALETSDFETHGIAMSYFYPADGVGPEYVYDHVERDEKLLGVTAIKDRVMSSRRNYVWGPNTVAEARPYIHMFEDGNGTPVPRLQYMTTIITFTERKGVNGGEVRLTPGGNPEVSITDALREGVVWVNTSQPDSWDAQISKELGLRSGNRQK